MRNHLSDYFFSYCFDEKVKSQAKTWTFPLKSVLLQKQSKDYARQANIPEKRMR